MGSEEEEEEEEEGEVEVKVQNIRILRPMTSQHDDVITS